MLRGVAHCKRLLAAGKAHPSRFSANHAPCYFFLCNSTASFSSSPRKSSSLNNYYIRKRRKWPTHPYEARWLESFASKLAKRFFKQSIKISKTHLLSDLINAHAAYEIDPTPQSYHFLFKTLIQKRPPNCYEQISQVLDHIEQVETFETPECIFVDLIRFYGDSDMFDDAVELLLRIPEFRCVPSVYALNALLIVLCKDEKGLEIIPRVLVKSQVLNIRIEESSFQILIRALCRIGRASNAFDLLNQMVDEGFDVDQKACSSMLATMCRQLDCTTGKIMGFLEDLKMLGFEPRIRDFFTVISFLVKKGKGMEALRLLKQMKMYRVKPDIMCYNLVLEALIQEKDFSNADKLFDELLVLGLVPDIHTYNVYINGLCMQDKVEGGIELMGSMKELGCLPDSNTFNTILRSLCEAGKLDRIIEVVDEMTRKCIQISPRTCEVLIDSFVSNGDVDVALILFNKMLDKNSVPQSTSLDKMICLMFKTGSFSEAEEVLEKVVMKKNIADQTIYHFALLKL
ncbi:hypothetical protein ACS0TY_015655 [Phlomoides rotata]